MPSIFKTQSIFPVILVVGIVLGIYAWSNWGKMPSHSPDVNDEAPNLETYWPTDGWRCAQPEDVGMSSDKLGDLVAFIQQRKDVQVDSVMIIRNGYVALDEYFNTFKKDEKHNVYSCTKSVVSTLIGIAIDKGYIERVEAHVLDLYPNRTVKNLTPSKESMTLKHLLTMSAGFDARDSYLYQWEGLRPMMESTDSVQHVLDLAVIEEPGTKFEYTNGVSHLLSGIITEKTGMTALKFGRETLFGPLGITDIMWKTDSLGRNGGYSELYLTPHDMGKIGYLFLNEGTWGEEQIVAEEWVRESTKKHIDSTIVDGYGYQWWVHPNKYYMALGYKGQFIFVVPEEDLVVVMTGGTPETFDFSLSLLENYIFPSIIK